MGIQNKRILQILAEAENGSLAQSTWQKYNSAQRHIKGAEKTSGVRFSFPFTYKMTMAYVGYLLSRGLRSESISVYLSGI